jgi:hypothetical protein
MQQTQEAANFCRTPSSEARDALMSQDWRHLSLEDADRAVANAVCCWPSAIGFDPVIDGIDFSVVVRQQLWPIVSDAARRFRGQREFVAVLDDFGISVPARLSDTSLAGKTLGYLGNLARRSRSLLGAWPRSAFRGICGRPSVLVPFPHRSWRRTTTAIENSGLSVVSETPVWHSIRRNRLLSEATEFADWFGGHIVEGLKCWSIDLSECQITALRQCLARSRAYTSLATSRFERCRADLVVVNTSCTSPTIEYVMAARRLGIATLALQYGLDCDRYAYDETFADNVAVWSETRRLQFQHTSTPPSSIRVTGNPEYDQRMRPQRSDRNGSYWLWVTRPHLPSLCKLASHDPAEGLSILTALLNALRSDSEARLVIKPHPNDYHRLYLHAIRAAGFADRVTLSNGCLRKLLPAASVVVTEDTTAGMDSLFFGKVLIHAHFGATQPVLPFVDYGAAIPALNADELIEALGRAEKRSDAVKLIDGQLAFLRDFAGPGDGESGRRLTEFLAQLVGA